MNPQTLNQGQEQYFFKEEKQLSIIVYGKIKACVLCHCIATGIILDDRLVYLVVPKGAATSYLVHTAQKPSAPFLAAYYVSQKVACVRNSPHKLVMHWEMDYACALGDS